ncbi:uncharacterized protein LOC114319626 [Camellia sinensis]|uniref:uncharacterized protein LOC114319626 n=2 Tax=Camellia sinensis TaxID=4442 RepID=UPI0010359804|nr:uncharacterized protein LOC114319626 [Camellia sinensis]
MSDTPLVFHSHHLYIHIAYIEHFHSLITIIYFIAKSYFKSLKEEMSSTSRAWIVAASVGAVEALKDQGFCRWNYTVRSMQQHGKTSLRSSAVVSRKVRGEKKAKQSEESVRKVMYLSCCWGPY